MALVGFLRDPGAPSDESISPTRRDAEVHLQASRSGAIVQDMRIGIDLGGTKIEGVALRHDGSQAARVRVATPPAYPALLQAVAAVVAGLDQQAGAAGTVGIGTPG